MPWSTKREKCLFDAAQAMMIGGELEVECFATH